MAARGGAWRRVAARGAGLTSSRSVALCAETDAKASRSAKNCGVIVSPNSQAAGSPRRVMLSRSSRAALTPLLIWWEPSRAGSMSMPDQPPSTPPRRTFITSVTAPATSCRQWSMHELLTRVPPHPRAPSLNHPRGHVPTHGARSKRRGAIRVRAVWLFQAAAAAPCPRRAWRDGRHTRARRRGRRSRRGLRG